MTSEARSLLPVPQTSRASFATAQVRRPSGSVPADDSVTPTNRDRNFGRQRSDLERLTFCTSDFRLLDPRVRRPRFLPGGRQHTNRFGTSAAAANSDDKPNDGRKKTGVAWERVPLSPAVIWERIPARRPEFGPVLTSVARRRLDFLRCNADPASSRPV